MTVSRQQVSQNGFRFAVTSPANGVPGKTWNYLISSPDEGNIYLRWVKDNRDQYLGRIEHHTGQVLQTSKPPADDEAFKVADRILRRVWKEDHSAYRDYGWDINPEGVEGVEISEPTISTALDFLADSFVVAIGYGLKRPMIRAHYLDQRFKIYLSQRGTVCLKSGKLTAPAEDGSRDPIGDEQYVGCLFRGKFLPARVVPMWAESRYNRRDGNDGSRWNDRPLRKMTPAEDSFLKELEKAPADFLARCSKDMSRCCYCYSALEDQRSKAAGYGPICAKHWGLPWGDERHGEKVPSFASIWTPEVHAMIVAVRATPLDQTVWGIFADYIEEKGMPRLACALDEKGWSEYRGRHVQLPRND